MYGRPSRPARGRGTEGGSTTGAPSGTTATRSAPSSSRTWAAVCCDGTWTVTPRRTARRSAGPKRRTLGLSPSVSRRNQQSCTETRVGSALGGTT